MRSALKESPMRSSHMDHSRTTNAETYTYLNNTGHPTDFLHQAPLRPSPTRAEQLNTGFGQGIHCESTRAIRE